MAPNLVRQKANSSYNIGLPDNMSDDESSVVLVENSNTAIGETRLSYTFLRCRMFLEALKLLRIGYGSDIGRSLRDV